MFQNEKRDSLIWSLRVSGMSGGTLATLTGMTRQRIQVIANGYADRHGLERPGREAKQVEALREG